MRTIELINEIDVDVTPEAAWAVVADYGRDPEWRSGVVTMAPSTPGIVTGGTTTAEEMHLAGRTLRNGGRVTSVGPGLRFTWATTSGSDADGARSVEAAGDGRARVRLELRVRPHGVERLLAPVLRRIVARTVAADAERLRVLLAAERGVEVR
jgi:hypothetical protein